MLSVSSLQGALNKGLRLGVNYPSNIILGPSYIGLPSQAGASAGVTEEQRLIHLQRGHCSALGRRRPGPGWRWRV